MLKFLLISLLLGTSGIFAQESEIHFNAATNTSNNSYYSIGEIFILPEVGDSKEVQNYFWINPNPAESHFSLKKVK